MCQHCQRSKTTRRVLTKQGFGPEEERAFRWWLDEYRDALGPVEDDIEAWLAGASEDDLASLESIRAEIESRVGNYANDFETVFREGSTRGAQAGRELTARRHQLDVSFDVVPERTLDVLDGWVEEAAGSTLETITEDSTRWLRGAHEEGLDIDDIADVINDELFEGRLEDHVAERAARTGTVATSNAGSHSAIEDSSAIAEEWLTSLDGRERETHAEANGQIVAVEQTFLVGDAELAHPGDPTAPIGEIVNCRCTVVPRFSDDLHEDEVEALENGERLKLLDSGDVAKLSDGATLDAVAV